MIEIRVPASTSNLGAGFDTLGLAVKLYLSVHVEERSDAEPPVEIRVSGDGADDLPSDEENLIYRAMKFLAVRENVLLPPIAMEIHNDIPLARGLGSSAAAIVAGLSAFEAITGRQLGARRLLAYGAAIEGHADNIAPCLMGGLVTTCTAGGDQVLAAKSEWPDDLQAVFVIPEFQLVTEAARAILPAAYSRQDAVFNLQRVALLQVAVATRRYELLREAMRDRLHQPARQRLVPGLEEILGMPDRDGLRGVSLSGAGPAVVAFADSHAEEIGREIASVFLERGIKSSVRLLEIDQQGRSIRGGFSSGAGKVD